MGGVQTTIVVSKQIVSSSESTKEQVSKQSFSSSESVSMQSDKAHPGLEALWFS